MNNLDKYFEKARNVEPGISQEETKKILAGKLSDGGIATNLLNKIRTYPMITTLITSAAIVGVLMLSQFTEPTNENIVDSKNKIEIIADNGEDGIIPVDDNEPKTHDHKKEKEFLKKNPPKPADDSLTRRTKIKNRNGKNEIKSYLITSNKDTGKLEVYDKNQVKELDRMNSPNLADEEIIRVASLNSNDNIVQIDEDKPESYNHKKEKEFEKKNPPRPNDENIVSKKSTSELNLDSRDYNWTSDEVDIKSVNTLKLTNDELNVLGVIVNKDNFKVNAFDKYVFTIYTNNEKEREYFDEDKDRDAFPTPAMVTTASGFKTLTLFKSDGMEAIVDRFESEDGDSKTLQITATSKSNTDLDIDENIPEFKFGEMSFDEYKTMLTGHKDSSKVISQLESLDDFKIRIEDKEYSFNFTELLKSGEMSPDAIEKFMKIKELESEVEDDITMKVEMDVNSEDGTRNEFRYVQKKIDRKVTMNSEDLSDEDIENIMITSLDSLDGDVIELVEVDDDVKQKSYKNETIGNKSNLFPGQKIWVEKEKDYKVFIERLDVPDPNNSINRMNYIVDKDTVKIDYYAELNDSETGTTIFMPDGFTKHKDYSKHKKRLDTYLELLGNNPSASMFKEKTNYQNPLIKLELTDTHGSKNVVDLLKESYLSKNNSVNIEDIETMKVQYEFNTYTVDFQQLIQNKNGELDFDNDPDLEFLKKDIDPKLSNRKNYKTTPVISWYKKRDNLLIESNIGKMFKYHNRILNESSNEEVFVNRIKEENSNGGTIHMPIKSLGEGKKIVINSTNLDDYDDVYVRDLLQRSGDNVDIQELESVDDNSKILNGSVTDLTKLSELKNLNKLDGLSNMSFSLIKHDINKLIPIEVSLDGDKTDFIVWYEATDEFLEKLPSRLIQKINPELNAADDQAEHCNNEPVKKDDAVMDVWSGCSGAIQGMKLYPNPAVDQSSVELSLKEDRSLSMSVYNLSGQLIKRIGNPTQYAKGQLVKPIDLTGINPGLYYVVVKSDLGEQALQRIIIE